MMAAELMPHTDAEVHGARRAIMRNVDLADRHLAAFLDFATPTGVDAASEVDVAALWREAMAIASPDPNAVGLDVAVDAARTTTHRRLLLRVLACGLENAHKHGAAPIMARARLHGSQRVFEIEDSGPGLAAEERQRVMRPFERGERGRSTPGTGLGLAIAAQIAARLGGRVELDQAQRGLIFRCVLPQQAP
jgi:signal transduction histidine kinase